MNDTFMTDIPTKQKFHEQIHEKRLFVIYFSLQSNCKLYTIL